MQNQTIPIDNKKTSSDRKPNTTNHNKVVRQPMVSELTGLSRSMIYLKMNASSPYFDAAFPRSISLGKRAVGWRLRKINSYLNNLK